MQQQNKYFQTSLLTLLLRKKVYPGAKLLCNLVLNDNYLFTKTTYFLP